jgi:hypothetical protein
MRKMVRSLGENDLVGFTYISGEKPHDAGDWEFDVSGMRRWEAEMVVRGTSALRFSMPLLYVEQHPTAFQALFVSFARRLKAVHGYGGHGLVLSAVRLNDNQPFEAYFSQMLHGLDVGHPVAGASHAHEGIKTVSWLTAINWEMVEKIGGLSVIRSELPGQWFALYDYGAGVVIQAGPKPEAAPTDEPKPARLVLPNMLLKPLRTQKVKLHYASKDGEPRIIGWGAQQWLQRFDVPEENILAYKAKLAVVEVTLSATQAAATRRCAVSHRMPPATRATGSSEPQFSQLQPCEVMSAPEAKDVTAIVLITQKSIAAWAVVRSSGR